MSNGLNRTHEIDETRTLEITVPLQVGCCRGEDFFDALRLADEFPPNGKKGCNSAANVGRRGTCPARLDVVALLAAGGVKL
jgi:hypothetical protein